MVARIQTQRSSSESQSMHRHQRLQWVVHVLALFLLSSVPAAGAGEELTGLEILKRTFDNLYDCDLKMSLEIELKDQSGGVSRRRANIARKRIRGHTHSIGRFLDPPWMRGTTMLMIDNADRSDDHFIYLPESKRTRRLTSVQGSDSFLGSDLWYEDLERRYPDEYDVVDLTSARKPEEATYLLRVRPTRENSAYDEIEFEIAKKDFYLLGTSYFRGDSKTPIRRITSSREHMVIQDGHRIPTQYVVRNDVRGTETVARFMRMEVNPELSDSLFRSVALEVGRKIPGLGRQKKKDKGM